ncbi:cellulose biosynthesis protein BcsG [Limnobacter sp.]|uniref:cellulose biosynthesis protein BcsG n=1 Tax=Limnobacter sp. TaxID=2003368 RepID=UPI00258FB9E6|nr:cellulose biosynthesis protein BcsG [Limnobacter sp.]
MLFWNLYFLVKIGLQLGGKLQMSPWLNLLLFVALLTFHWLPIRRVGLKVALSLLIFLPLAFVLALHEFGLVLSTQLFDEILALRNFSGDYLLELVQRSISPTLLWGVAIGLLALRVLYRYLRITSWVGGTLALVCIGLLLPGKSQNQAPLQAAHYTPVRDGALAAEQIALGPQDFAKLQKARNLLDGQGAPGSESTDSPQSSLTLFFQEQKAIALNHFNRGIGQPDFDLVFLHICSLAWSDLRFAKQTQHPLLKQANFVFTHFNSATSYSGPAALRLLRSSCGQPEHNALYQRADPSCLLFNQLNQAGYKIEVGLNHNGSFDNFKTEVLDNIGAPYTQPIQYNQVALGTVAFDGSPVARDGDYLKAWWKQRMAKDAGPVALYYNTITMHDGNQLPNQRMSSVQSYPIRLSGLLDDIESVIALIRQSGKRALVVVIPEHGAGMTGEYGQLVGLRELPTPAITEVPVLGYWIDPQATEQSTNSAPIEIKQPTSYFQLTRLIDNWMTLSPTDQDKNNWAQVAAGLKTTRFVAQQGDITILEKQNQFLIHTPGEPWKPLGAAK